MQTKFGSSRSFFCLLTHFCFIVLLPSVSFLYEWPVRECEGVREMKHRWKLAQVWFFFFFIYSFLFIYDSIFLLLLSASFQCELPLRECEVKREMKCRRKLVHDFFIYLFTYLFTCLFIFVIIINIFSVWVICKGVWGWVKWDADESLARVEFFFICMHVSLFLLFLSASLQYELPVRSVRSGGTRRRQKLAQVRFFYSFTYFNLSTCLFSLTRH